MKVCILSSENSGSRINVLTILSDGLVYVWQRENGNLVEKLPGHSGTVNCVAWNPKNSSMFASGGDDRLIRM